MSSVSIVTNEAIALGHKQIEDNPWDTFEDKYRVDTDTKGTVTRIIDKGVIVTLAVGVDGFIPMTHLGHPKLKKATDYYKEGDEIPCKVIEFDKENKKIVLSITGYFKDRETQRFGRISCKAGCGSDYVARSGERFAGNGCEEKE